MKCVFYYTHDKVYTTLSLVIIKVQGGFLVGHKNIRVPLRKIVCGKKNKYLLSSSTFSFEHWTYFFYTICITSQQIA